MKVNQIILSDDQGVKFIARYRERIYQFTLKNKQFSPSRKWVNFDGYIYDYDLGWINPEEVEVVEELERFTEKPKA